MRNFPATRKLFINGSRAICLAEGQRIGRQVTFHGFLVQEDTMSERLQDFLNRFNLLVAANETKGLEMGCLALIRSLGDAVHDAAFGDKMAMEDARFCAEALLALKAETVLPEPGYDDHHHVAKLLTTAGEVKDTPSAFEAFDDLFCLRAERPPGAPLH